MSKIGKVLKNYLIARLIGAGLGGLLDGPYGLLHMSSTFGDIYVLKKLIELHIKNKKRRI